VVDASARPAPLELIERELTELASHIHAAMCRWLQLVAEYDAREGWAQWGCRSCADWVSWRCSVALPSAREHVRVARRLGELPAIRAAFAAGRLSYSKVRALTRLQAVEREEELLALAEDATASQLERLVRGYRRVVAVEDAAGGGRPERWVRWDYDDDGSLLLRGRLPAEEGALVVAALEAAREALARDRGALSDEAEGARSEGADWCGDDEDVSAETSAPTVGEARADALLLLADSMPAGDARDRRGRSGGDRYQVVVHVDLETLATGDSGNRCELAAGVPLAPETARRLACDASIVRLAETGGRALDVGRRTRSIPPALRRALDARDGGCRFPGCGATRFVDAHHIEHWADGGATKLTNLVQLCRHHHRLLHEGGYAVEARGDGLTFRRPDGRVIPGCPALPPGRVAGLRMPPRRPGAPPAAVVRPDACVPRWRGERLDLALGVDALLAFAPPRRLTAADVSAETSPRSTAGRA
jgi:hypothetical protein